MRMLSLVTALVLAVSTQASAQGFQECRFGFEVDTQSSALQALIADAEREGGFWRPIAEAPDDVRALARHIGRLDVCLMTPDGQPREISRGGVTHTVPSPLVTHCTAALLPGNRLLTNHHCFYEPKLVAAGFTVVREARVNFGYTDRDVTGQVQTFLVDNDEIAGDPGLDALVLQVLGGDANAATGGGLPMLMQPEATPRRAMTMIHHPNGEPLKYSTGTCQVHRRQVEVPGPVSSLRHSCESAFGSSGALLLDARSLAVMGLHNQGGLSAQGGFNGGHKIAAIEAALSLGFEAAGPDDPARADPQAEANAALTNALLERDPVLRRAALGAILARFPGSAAAQSATNALTLMEPVPERRPEPEDGPVSPPEQPRDPQVFAVKPDGSGDFTVLADALKNARSGDRIDLFPGRYALRAVVSEAVEIVGQGNRRDIVLTGAGGPIVTWTAKGGALRNLTLRHDAPGGAALIFDGGAAEVLGNDLQASGGAAAIAIRAGADPDIRGNLIHDGGGIVVTDAGLGTLEANDIFQTEGDALRILSGGDPLVLNNKIRSTGLRGIVVYRDGRGRLFGNAITGSALAGIEVTSGGDPLVRRNAIEDGRDVGVLVQDGGKGRFESNALRRNARAGVAIRTEGAPLLRDNRIRNSDGVGIAVFDGGAGLLEANVITGNRRAGLAISQGGRPDVVRNTITGNDGPGVWIAQAGEGRIVGNDLSANGAEALRIDPDAGTITNRENTP